MPTFRAQPAGGRSSNSICLDTTPPPRFTKSEFAKPALLEVAHLAVCLNAACITAIVALMVPILIGWGRRASVSPKRLLLPLSYACE